MYRETSGNSQGGTRLSVCARGVGKGTLHKTGPGALDGNLDKYS